MQNIGQSWIQRLLLLGVAVLIVGCSGYGVRRNAVGGAFSEKKNQTIQTEYDTEGIVPYKAKLTYGEICVNSKRYGRELCFPCYSPDQGGCESVVDDIVDRAVTCGSPIGPSGPRQMPMGVTGLGAPPYSPTPMNVPQPTNTYGNMPNTYPNYSR